MNAAEMFGKDWLHFIDCVNFGSSNLDADAILFMNEVPGQMQRALTTLETFVENSKHKEDEVNQNFEEGSQGGYSEQLTEAINLLAELKG